MGLPVPTKINLKERKKILVVDDDKIIVDTVVQALEDDEHGYELMSAADGVEAELQITRFKPDLIILDIMIPDINGYEVCRKVKSDPATKGIKDYRAFRLSQRRGILTDEDVRRRCLFFQAVGACAAEE